MKTAKAILEEMGVEMFEVIESELMKEGEQVSITFTFDIDGLVDVSATKISEQKLDLNEME